MSKGPNDDGKIVRLMLWADDEFGFDFTWLIIVLALAALGGVIALVVWVF